MPTNAKNVDFNVLLGQRIGTLRSQRGISQEALGEALGVSRVIIQHWERGSRQIKAAHILQLANYFDVTVDHLLDETKPNAKDITAIEVCNFTGLSAASVMQLHLLKDSNEIKFIKRFLDDFVSFTDATNLQNLIFTAALALYNARNNHHGMQWAAAKLNNIIASQPDGTYSIPPLDAADYYRSTAVQITSRKIDNIISEMVEQLCDEIEYSMESVGSYNINDTVLTPNNSEFEDLPF